MTPNPQRAKRLSALYRLLIWEGEVSRRRVMELHGLSGIRASQWIRELRDSHPDWLDWDAREKAYRPTPAAFQAVEEILSKDRGHDGGLSIYLPEVGVGADDLAGPLGDIAIPAWDFSRVSPRLFAQLRSAIRAKQRIEIGYRSMGNPQIHTRTVEPHVLVKGGRRWHVRGFCLEAQEFRDYVLGRIGKLTVLKEAAQSDATQDIAWNQIVKLRITPHPALSPEQQTVVRAEYFGGTAARTESCRGALVPYLIQDLRIALDLQTQRPPDYQLAIAANEDVKKWLFPI